MTAPIRTRGRPRPPARPGDGRDPPQGGAPMPRRARRRESAARRRARLRRARLPARWPAAKPAGAKTPLPRVIRLTAARRLSVARRRAVARGRIGEPAPPATLDFHLSACVSCAREGGRVLMDYWSRRGSYPVHETGRNAFVTI